MRVLITGAAGFIGRQLLDDLAQRHPDWTLVAADIRPLAQQGLKPNIESVSLDISQAREVDACVQRWKPEAIVHLASVVNPPRGMSDAHLHAIDVGGTRAVIDAALAHGVNQLIVTSSGAAYGYYPENAEWIDEQHPLRGHELFAYARHKREVELLLADARKRSPQLRQLVLRPGTILGERVNNQITDLFEKRSVLGIKGHDSRFVFIWDQDVVDIIRVGLERNSAGIYNLAGDGALSMAEIAGILGKPYRPLPAGLLRGALALLKPLGLTQYGPEQLDFLRYRPVLDNRRLKEEFGYRPRYSSREAFLAFLKARGIAAQA
ncbi:NAD-dependent epimerase/dehydratase family protein [Metapseudomonas resinovorans]|uniref:NAD-dependent epimerase/dehydratase family protein n=1 Tax=Metapseudomonas resinovorans NBRC 106553 TaxID=1245471 RepID=S6APZ1_METRE|nr:NAD-dependent epimerase/dehydratase family protein [Pseudomonas resinovorans]BAN45826.1 NAD-dependent epimerase/dehydratase family protein [Pseudomonas resinovorans NBRC 106553]